MRTCAVLVAAGLGERLGAGVPKALVPVGGAPLLVHAARTCAAVVDDLVVVGPPDFLTQVRQALVGVGLERARVCGGGLTRQESVALGLAACPLAAEVVAVHDAARVLVTESLLRATLAALVPPWDAVAPAVALADTVKRVADDGETVLGTVDRSTLRAVQTPQVFRLERLRELHDRFPGDVVTDDLALVERAGGRVRLIPGEARNFKVTVEDDRLRAAGLIGMVRQ